MSFKVTITPAMKRQFASEADEHLDTLEKMLLRLETTPGDDQAVHSAFRAVHSIKGSSDYLNFSDIKILAHHLEDIMDDIRSGSMAINQTILTLLFESLDQLRKMNRHIADDDYQERNVSDLINRISQMKITAPATSQSSPQMRPAVDVKAVFSRSSLEHLSYMRKICQAVVDGASAKGAMVKLTRLLKTFSNSAAYVGAKGVVVALEAMEQSFIGKRALYKKMACQLLERADDVERALNTFGDSESEGAAPRKSEKDQWVDLSDREMKVAPAKVESFMNRVAELTIAKNSLSDLCNTIPTEVRPLKWAGELKRMASIIDKLSYQLQKDVMNIRLLRMDWLFDRLPLMLRDLIQKRSKKAEMTLRGGNIEIDRKVIAQLADPLVHLIRNAVDHGIESSEQRKHLGKPETGVITITASQKGSDAIIDVSDDGRGIDIEAVKKAALKRKITSWERLDDQPEEEIQNLIFAPGLSTKKDAGTVSGRGVGMDVVYNNLKRIGGDATVHSKPGSGTRIRLRVPISIALMETLLTETQGEQYAFPFSAVVETIIVRPNQIQELNGREAMSYCETVLDLIDLGELLGLKAQDQMGRRPSQTEFSVVVVTSGGGVRGIFVERILGRQAILARPLEVHLNGIRELSGAALLANGSIALILDPAGLV